MVVDWEIMGSRQWPVWYVLHLGRGLGLTRTRAVYSYAWCSSTRRMAHMIKDASMGECDFTRWPHR